MGCSPHVYGGQKYSGTARRCQLKLVFEPVYRNVGKTAFRTVFSRTVEAIGKCCPFGQTRRPPGRNACRKRLGWYDDSRAFGFRCPADLAGREPPAFGLSYQDVQSFNSSVWRLAIYLRSQDIGGQRRRDDGSRRFGHDLGFIRELVAELALADFLQRNVGEFH